MEKNSSSTSSSSGSHDGYIRPDIRSKGGCHEPCDPNVICQPRKKHHKSCSSSSSDDMYPHIMCKPPPRQCPSHTKDEIFESLGDEESINVCNLKKLTKNKKKFCILGNTETKTTEFEFGSTDTKDGEFEFESEFSISGSNVENAKKTLNLFELNQNYENAGLPLIETEKNIFQNIPQPTNITTGGILVDAPLSGSPGNTKIKEKQVRFSVEGDSDMDLKSDSQMDDLSPSREADDKNMENLFNPILVKKEVSRSSSVSKSKRVAVSYGTKVGHPWSEYNESSDGANSSIYINGKVGGTLNLFRDTKYVFYTKDATNTKNHGFMLTNNPLGGQNSRIIPGGFQPLENGSRSFTPNEHTPKHFFYADITHPFAGGIVVLNDAV